MNFGKMITFSISGTTKRKTPDNKESEKFGEDDRKKNNTIAKESFGTAQDINDRATSSQNALIQDSTQTAIANNYAASVDRQAEIEKQKSLQKPPRPLSDIQTTARQEQYIQLSNEVEDFVTQHILFWQSTTNILKDIELTTSTLAGK